MALKGLFRRLIRLRPQSWVFRRIPRSGAACVSACIVLTADFAEAGDAGVARKDELVRNVHGMRLIGLNCPGFINLGIGLALTSPVEPESNAAFPLTP